MAEVIVIPPEGVSVPSMNHRAYGMPEESWCYETSEGKPIFYVARYKKAGGGKQILPWSWSVTSKSWVMKSYPNPRPLYGLPELKKYPGLPVLIVEGEKACEAARKIVNANEMRYVVMTWAGGCKAINTADWEVLRDA
jgi:putative DNA primase/helicase